MRIPRILLVTCILTILGPAASRAVAEAPRAAMAERHRPLLTNHCVKCHGAGAESGVRLDDLPLAIDDVAAADRWQRVLAVLNAGEMPPEDEPQPDPVAKTDFLDDLSNAMVTARRLLSDQHGAITMRRLNRREYRTTMRELLGVNLNVLDLPADVAAGSFDTVGANLFMSSNQFEQYLALGRSALREAFAVQRLTAPFKSRFEVEKSFDWMKKRLEQQQKIAADFETWAKAVADAAAKPENSAVVEKILGGRTGDHVVRSNWKQISGAPDPKDFGLASSRHAENFKKTAAVLVPYLEQYFSQPALDSGAYLSAVADGQNWNSLLGVEIGQGLPGFNGGDYVVRARVAATGQATGRRRFVELAYNPTGKSPLRSVHEVTGTLESPQVIETTLSLLLSDQKPYRGFAFIRERGTADRLFFDETVRATGSAPGFAIWVDWIEIERKPVGGQQPPPGIAALAGIPLNPKAPPPPASDVQAAIERFAREAFRGREVPAAYVNRLTGLYAARLAAGDTHVAALEATLAVVLASPPFIYLAEPATEQGHRPLTDLELASRLSYLLWGAPPDATLRELAAGGELRKPEVLAAQVGRLLDDPRSSGFVEPFVHQWLGLDRLDFFEFNRRLFPQFDESAELVARREMPETFAYLIRENAPATDLLGADYVVVNAGLAYYYGIEGVTGDAFRRVPVPAGMPRGGLMTMAGILAMGGNAEYTSPVERGVWVLKKLVNDPPAPAPANIPAIGRLADKVLTTRERLAAHQEQPQCASCHRRIDPIGLGLENFDAVGQWRTTDAYQVMLNGRPIHGKRREWDIDPSGKIYGGPEFADVFALREYVASRSEPFRRGLAAALVEYALGRPCGFSDEPLIDEIVGRAARSHDGIREFILALVESKQFRTK